MNEKHGANPGKDKACVISLVWQRVLLCFAHWIDPHPAFGPDTDPQGTRFPLPKNPDQKFPTVGVRNLLHQRDHSVDYDCSIIYIDLCIFAPSKSSWIGSADMSFPNNHPECLFLPRTKTTYHCLRWPRCLVFSWNGTPMSAEFSATDHILVDNAARLWIEVEI